MELRHLRYFIAVAQELHFSRAAERLGIAPPTLTQQIQALEDEVGVKLLIRTKRSVHLSAAGVLFLDGAQETIRRAEQAVIDSRRANRGELGRIVIGHVISASYSGFLAPAIRDYCRKWPSVDVQLRRLETPPQLQALAEGIIDVGFVRALDGYPYGIQSHVVFRDDLAVALPTAHRLAQRSRLKCSDLADEIFVAPPIDVEWGVSGYISPIALEGGFTPQIWKRAQDFLTVLVYVSAGLGIAVMPRSLERMKIRGVVYRPISVNRKADLSVIFRNREKSPIINEFVQVVRERSKL